MNQLNIKILFSFLATVGILGSIVAYTTLTNDSIDATITQKEPMKIQFKGITTTGENIDQSMALGEIKTIQWKVGAFYPDPTEILLSSDSELLTIQESKLMNNDWHQIPILITIPKDFEQGTYEITLSATKKGDDNEVMQFNLIMTKKMELIIT